MKYHKCTPECKFRRSMVDLNDPTYKIQFCDFEMEAIAKGTSCIYFTPKKKDYDKK